MNGYTFDPAGNTTVDAEGRQFTYDAENKQVKVRDSQSQTIGEYFYNGEGERVKKIVPATGETTVFVYDAEGKMIAEYSTELSQTPQVSYLTHDHLGSPRILTDENGSIISRRDFRPYGEQIIRFGYGQDTIRKQFATYERDTESDLDFAQARYYSPNLGRFFSIDPENADAEEEIPQSWNAYAYARNNPLKYGDPSGEGVQVCTTSGERQCTDFTEKQWQNFLKINKESGEYTIKGNKVFIKGTDEVAFVITSSTMLSEDRMKLFRVGGPEAIKKAKVVGVAAAGAAVVGTACGLTGGAGCVAAAGAALREGVRRASPAAIQELAAALRFTGTTALRQANPARRVPLQTLATAILTGQRMADPQPARRAGGGRGRRRGVRGGGAWRRGRSGPSDDGG
ncbi:hypothetical protein J4558_25010 [Leptolyngbya sp. 15MV]|nr:hypothetical protein J4558_25010 [Leptolyngbya sp. 15MV]